MARTPLAVTSPSLAQRPDLTPELCQKIVVQATPESQNFTNASQDLFALGVVDAVQKQVHQGRIQSALSKLNYHIAQGDITSGPGVLVSACVDSVLSNAH